MLAHSCYTTEDALLFGVLMVKRQMCMYVTHGKDHVFLKIMSSLLIPCGHHTVWSTYGQPALPGAGNFALLFQW